MDVTTEILPQLTGLTTQLFTLTNFVFCLAIWAIIAMPKKYFAIKHPEWNNNKYYTGLILPSAPIVVGALLALFMPHFAYPALFVGKGSRVLFGVFAGFMSSHVVRVVKSLLKKAGDDSPNSTGDLS